MRLILRPYFAFALVALLTLTGQSMVVARGASAATGQIVICTGTGPVTVSVDAEGQPKGPVHICPDCMATALMALPVQALDVVSPKVRQSGFQASASKVWAGGIDQTALARGPPVSA